MSTYRTNKLSDPECRSAKPKDKLYKIADGGGLHLHVLTSGSKVWRYSYRIHGKQKTYTIGNYPHISLSMARTSRDSAKKLVHDGIDPSQQKQIVKRQINENSFQGVACCCETWLAQQKPEWSQSHYERLKGYLVNDVFPVLGNRAIAEIEAPEIIPIIMTVSNRGAVDVLVYGLWTIPMIKLQHMALEV